VIRVKQLRHHRGVQLLVAVADVLTDRQGRWPTTEVSVHRK
jgi:hypothetical protein